MVYEELRSLSASWGAPRPAQGAAPLPSLWGWRRHPPGTAQRQPSSAEIVGIGALSKLAATVITYPSQVPPRTKHHQSPCRAAPLLVLPDLALPISGWSNPRTHWFPTATLRLLTDAITAFSVPDAQTSSPSPGRHIPSNQAVHEFRPPANT